MTYDRHFMIKRHLKVILYKKVQFKFYVGSNIASLFEKVSNFKWRATSEATTKVGI